jgi:hypothetical protein
LDRLITARSFYPKQRLSIFEGLEKVKVGIARYLRSILGFKSADGTLLLKVRAMEGGDDPKEVVTSRVVLFLGCSSENSEESARVHL